MSVGYEHRISDRSNLHPAAAWLRYSRGAVADTGSNRVFHTLLQHQNVGFKGFMGPCQLTGLGA